MISVDVLSSLSGPSKHDRLDAIERLRGQLPEDVQKLLLDVEQVQATLTDCRNKDRYLEDLLRNTLDQSEDTITCVFHHLLGTLYINFEKFWGPTIRAIVELINTTKFKTRLLRIILDEFKLTNDRIYNDVVAELPDDRPDHVLHRNFVLQILARFPDFVEANSVIFMDQLFRFIEAEMMVSPFIEKLAKQDLTTESKSDKPTNGKRRRRPDTNRSKSKETFITASRIIQTFHDMSVVHRQDQFREFILLLMTSRDGSIQKAAFKCFLAYDVEHVRQYADKILRLLDDKKIRSEFSAFSINSDDGLVNSDHRKQLIPVIHRILFGRMVGKIGKKTTGRDKADKRKHTVMRYIAGCTADEIISFFELLFDPIFEHSSVPYDEMRETIRRHIDIQRYVPLNKLQAMVSTLTAYIESVANLRPETLPLLLKMISVVTTLVLIPLEDAQIFGQLCMRSIKTLKILKRNCLDIATEFFRSFPYYRFTQKEIDFVFCNLIWPTSKGFIDKNHASITPMLKLIDTFMENEVYHKLIVKRNKTDSDEYLLRSLMDLYDSDKIERLVSKYIAQMLCNLLKLETEEDEDVQMDETDREKHQLEDSDSILPTYDASLYKLETSDMTLGYKMIICFIPEIINRLKKNCETFLHKKSSSFRLEKSELLILSTLSSFLKDSSHCLVAAKLLLSTLEHQKSADLIINTLRTVGSLLGQVNELDDSAIIDFIANFLSYQSNGEQRKEVCGLIRILTSIDSTINYAGEAVIMLNSTMDDLSEVPNLEKWNEGFNLATQYLDSLDDLSMNDPSRVRRSLTLLLHQVGFIVSTIDRYDFSIRENCMTFYQKVAYKLNLIDQTRNERMLNELLSNILLEKFIKKGLRSTNESIRHTCLEILRITSLNCNEKHPVLWDCHMFCNPNQDLDFWINIKHIQLHNRSKALARLLADENLEKVSRKTLSSYFLPIASSFLFNKNYKSVAALSDNAIKLIGFICNNLSWKTYEATLVYYLDMLTKSNATYQRTNVKLITEILKNFNFDLTNCEEAMQFEEENQKLEKRMQKRCGHSSAQNQTKKAAKLNPSTARMIYNSVTKKLVPRLNSCLNEMTRVDFEYDKNMSDYMPEKDEIKRIPIAYAIVQILCLLPGKYIILRDQLPPILLKLTTFLRSKNEATRKTARATFLRVLSFVGPMYLPDMIRILKQQLDKGFYIHVLNYTIHSVLDGMALNYGDLDSSVEDLIGLCKQEIFGRPSEDKEIAQILSKTFEAKKTKSYDTLTIIASFISADKLDALTTPFKDLLKTSTEPKVVNKLSVCFQRIFTGLSQNSDFPIDKLIEFIQRSIEDSIPSLKVRDKVNCADLNTGFVREDRFLIAKDKSKNRVKSRINEKGNLHMVVENSLRLLLLVFEKNKSSIKRKETLQRKLNGLISLLTTCLKSSSPRCVMRSLKCLYFIAQAKIDLPDFETECESIVKRIFILLSLYNGVGMVQGDNYEMISMCFKTLTLLLLKCKHVRLDDNQIRALMSYIEQDLNDATRQSTAFRALDSLLRRGFKSPELTEIMKKVGELLVRSSDESIRSLSVRIWQTYLFEYQHDPVTLQSYLNGFIRQIDYEFIDGRKSILKMLRVLVEKLPESILRNNFDLNFPLLAERIANDDSREVRLLVGRLIVLLLQRIPDIQEHALKKLILPWASVDKLTIRILGIKLLSTLVEANTNIFEKNLKSIVDIIHKSIEPTPDTVVQSGEAPRNVSELDKLKYHAIRLFARLIERDLVQTGESQSIWQNLACHQLAHWHEPIVLTSCKLYLSLLTKTSYLDKKLTRTLCDKFIELIDRYDSTNPIYAYSTQGLIVLGQNISKSKVTLEFEQNYVGSFENGDILSFMRKLDNLPDDGFVHEKLPYGVAEVRKKCNLMWIAVKMLMQAKKEAALYRLNECHRRDLVLRWSAVIAQELGSTRIMPYVYLLMMTPIRELTDKASAPSLVPLAEDLLKFIKSLVGVHRFNEIHSKIQLYYTRKRVERKRETAVLKVRDQSRGSKRKIEDNKKKQILKKRKIVKRKGFK